VRRWQHFCLFRERTARDRAHTGASGLHVHESARTPASRVGQRAVCDRAHTGASAVGERTARERTHTGASGFGLHIRESGRALASLVGERAVCDRGRALASLVGERAVCDRGRALASLVGERATRDCAHTGASSHELRRAKQTIPPATRRKVLRRERGRCAVPACRNSQYLDVHHILSRSEGGSNDADNLIVLCGAHHRSAHRGELEISGRVSTGVRFRHADGSGYGRVVDSSVVQSQVKVFGALRRLGFREAEARRVLAEICTDRELREATSASVLREAVAKLTTPGG
jgi:hypothetical protein